MAPPTASTDVDTSANPDPENNKPDASENEKGGSEGKSERKVNKKRKESAKEEEARLRLELADLNSRQNRDPGISADIDKLKNLIKHAVLKQRKSEVHWRR
jgi:hypothetical protein